MRKPEGSIEACMVKRVGHWEGSGFASCPTEHPLNDGGHEEGEGDQGCGQHQERQGSTRHYTGPP